MRQSRFDASFAALDCYTEPLTKAFTPQQLAQPFDVVSMQFCMHYAFETAQKARCMLKNVSEWLRPGGVFLGTVPNADQLLYVCLASACSASVFAQLIASIAHDWTNCHLTLRIFLLEIQCIRSDLKNEPLDRCLVTGTTSISKMRSKMCQSTLLIGTTLYSESFCFILFYSFGAIWTRHASDDFTDTSLCRMAAQYGLHPVYKKEFHEVFEENKEREDFKSLMVRMNVCDASGASSMEDDEWEAVSKFFFPFVRFDAFRLRC